MIARHPLEATLIVLVGLAVATLCASRVLPGFLPGVLLANVILLGLALLKGRWILLDFLGLRTAPAIWRALVTAWVLGVVSFAFAVSAARLLI
jgi:hypothetical protein